MSLAQMLQKQKERKLAEANKTSPAPAATPADNGTDAVPAGVAAVSSSDSPAPAAPAKLTAFKLGGKPATGGKPPQESTPAPSESADTLMSLDDLSDSEDDFTVPSLGTMDSGFPDEIPCTAPTRELPEDLDTKQQEFVKQLDSIYEVVHDPELFGQMIRVIMQELNEVPDYIKFMADQDVHVMIRGLRQSMGLAKVKKAEKATKTRGSKKAPASAAILSTAEELFNSEDW